MNILPFLDRAHAMKQRYQGWIHAGVGCFLIWSMTHGVRAETDPQVERRDALAWLTKIQTAAQKQNYSGTFVLQQGNMVQSSRVEHLYDAGTEYEKLEVLDGRPRIVFRQNEQIYAFIPDRKLLLIEKRDAKDTFPALIATTGSEVLEQYTVKKEGADRVAGIDCQIIGLIPKDNYRYAYRLWADQQTGLLIKAQIISADNEVVEQIAFSQITVGAVLDKSKIRIKPSDMQGWRNENIDGVPINVGEMGWTFREAVPGFKKIHERKRMMPGPLGAREVSQIMFSDGLSAISVFIEAVTDAVPKPAKTEGVGGHDIATRESIPHKEGVMRRGATHMLSKHIGEARVVLLGETPAVTLQIFATGIEYKQIK